MGKLAEVWHELHDDVKKDIVAHLGIKSVRRQNSRLSTGATQSTERILLNKDVKSNIIESDLEDIFNRPGWKLDVSSIECFHKSVKTFRGGLFVDRIRWRLIAVAVGRLQRRFPHKDEHFPLLVKYISQFAEDKTEKCADEITRDFRGWAGAGKRYDLLIEDLGHSDVLLVLPEDISEST